MAWVWSMAHSMAYPLTYLNFVVFASVNRKKLLLKKKPKKPHHCCFHWWQKCSIKPKLSHFTLTHDLKRKAVWNSTYEQIKVDMKWHTQTLLEKKTIKRGGLFKKRFHYTPWCDAMRKLMFSKSMFCLFLWQLLQVLLWFKIRPSGTFFLFSFNFSPISDWGYQKVSRATRYSNFPVYPPSNP